MAPISRVCFSTSVLADLAKGVRIADRREVGGIGRAGSIGRVGGGGGVAAKAAEAD